MPGKSDLELSFLPVTAAGHDEFLALMLENMADYLDVLVSKMGMTIDEFKNISRSVGRVFSINQEGNVAGYYWIEERGDELHLHGLILKASYQGKGIGSEVLKELERRYKDRVSVIELGVNQENDRAIHLYQRSGYREIKILDDLGFYIMQKRLS
jgi:ribosomal protein S18 acetylase RimI-like enzyme